VKNAGCVVGVRQNSQGGTNRWVWCGCGRNLIAYRWWQRPRVEVVFAGGDGSGGMGLVPGPSRGGGARPSVGWCASAARAMSLVLPFLIAAASQG